MNFETPSIIDDYSALVCDRSGDVGDGNYLEELTPVACQSQLVDP